LTLIMFNCKMTSLTLLGVALSARADEQNF